jgi:hypothetical protein
MAPVNISSLSSCSRAVSSDVPRGNCRRDGGTSHVRCLGEPSHDIYEAAEHLSRRGLCHWNTMSPSLNASQVLA